MKNTILFFLIVVSTLNLYCQQDNRDFPFPKGINSQKTALHTRVKGTNVFLKLNEDFVLDDKSLFLKSDKEKGKRFGEYITFYDRYSTYEEGKISLTRGNTIKDTIFCQETKFNDRQALYFEGTGRSKNVHLIQLIIDIDGLALVISARSQLDQPSHRSKMLEAIETMVFDKTVIYDPLEMANFSFDRSITNFKFIKTFIGSYKFTEDGADDENQLVNSIDFRELYKSIIDNTHHHTFGFPLELSQSYAKSLIERLYKKNNDVVEIFEITTSKIGKYEAVSFEVETFIEGKKCIHMHTILNDEKRSVEFTGFINNRYEEFKRKYLETLKSMIID